MGSIGGLLGVSGGASGTGYAKPTATGANLTNPVTAQQIAQTNQLANQGLTNQQGLIAATQPGAQQTLASQQQLLGQLGLQAQGAGPNPALNQLQQYTGQNVAQQAALMAGQRGSSQNAGLIARQAAQQGAATQQQAVGQGAQMSAQQQLANQQQLAGLQSQIYGQQAGAVQGYNQATQQEQGQLLNAQSQYNTVQENMQANINNANAGLATTQMQGQQGLIGGLGNAASAGIGALLTAAPAAAAAAHGGQVHSYAYGTPPSGVPQSGQYDTSFQGLPDDEWQSQQSGAIIPPAAPQAPQAPVAPTAPPAASAGPKSGFVKFMQGVTQSNQQGNQQKQPTQNYGNPGANALAQGIGSFGNLFKSPTAQSNQQGNQQKQPTPINNDQTGPDTPQTDISSPDQDNTVLQSAKGGKVPALLSPGEKYLPPDKVEKVKKGANPMALGKTIPGKPKVGGAKDSYKNDTVKANLDEGGIVIPRSVTQGANAHWNAMKFVHQTLKKNKNG